MADNRILSPKRAVLVSLDDFQGFTLVAISAGFVDTMDTRAKSMSKMVEICSI